MANTTRPLTLKTQQFSLESCRAESLLRCESGGSFIMRELLEDWRLAAARRPLKAIEPLT
jgi:hypothetical protein